MAAKAGAETVMAPGQLVISAYAPCTDVALTVRAGYPFLRVFSPPPVASRRRSGAEGRKLPSGIMCHLAELYVMTLFRLPLTAPGHRPAHSRRLPLPGRQLARPAGLLRRTSCRR